MVSRRKQKDMLVVWLHLAVFIFCFLPRRECVELEEIEGGSVGKTDKAQGTRHRWESTTHAPPLLHPCDKEATSCWLALDRNIETDLKRVDYVHTRLTAVVPFTNNIKEDNTCTSPHHPIATRIYSVLFSADRGSSCGPHLSIDLSTFLAKSFRG